MTNFNKFISQLENKLQRPLPGKAAHQKLMPVTRRKFPANPDLSRAKPSSVLILFYPQNDRPHIVFIERPQYDGVHSGQMAFPGGKAESTDKSLQQTALRETGEEIGVNINDIKIIGKLTELYIPPSNYLVEPFVGFLNYMPGFVPEIKEVSEIVTVGFDEITDEKNFQVRNIDASGLKYNVPCFYVQKKIIWGATSMILNELVEVMMN
jgi:8-oxo-dGTP pyrophosphatase MutT (NUDIX family)